ncbi:LOW QUALITY PROTEIN: hypothetical protein PHMEG_00022033 [Phytophthora megakarya]|uniref:Reverse transcriptase n=1 Tax=Phytophthora megakarya TaxID=4795 RepID=A0A225VLQ9_9STRA|nr:LOW QUALITY PROTEIN: hypothetical protein PHMEG_00022033 [Phytophthora megakarya]
MCIDYRVVNSFIQLSNYPLPLIDLIAGFEGMMWFMSLDMASGFWAVRLTERAKLISAFTCPFGHFQWVHMSFGLKNAPLIYQQMINNCLWGLVRLPPEEEAIVDQDVLDYLKLNPLSPSDEMDIERSMTPLVEQMTASVLGQMHDGLVQPVRFTGRVLNDAELKYHIAEKEGLAVVRVLHVLKNLIEGCPLIIYTRYSVLKWAINSKTAEGRLVSWGVALSQYDLEIRKVCRDEDGLPAIMDAGITPREHLDEVAEVLIPAKGRVRPPPVVSVEMLSEEYSGFRWCGQNFHEEGSCGCILWQIPEWKVMDARGYILDGVTVNDAKYFGLPIGLVMALEREIQNIVVVGDSRIVLQQVQCLINCNQPNLQRRLAECETLKKRFQTIRLVHMMRKFNQAADYLTSKTLDDLEKRHVEVVSKIREQLVKPSEGIDTRVHRGDPIQDSGVEDGDSGTNMVLALNMHLYPLPPESWPYSRDRELK